MKTQDIKDSKINFYNKKNITTKKLKPKLSKGLNVKKNKTQNHNIFTPKNNKKENTKRYTELNINERPREKLLYSSSEILTDQELLALVIRTGSKNISNIELAREILIKHHSLKNLLNVNIKTLMLQKDLGLAKASSIKACCEIAHRILNHNQEKISIKTPEDVYNKMKKYLYSKTKEYLYLINLDSKNYIISIDLLTSGTENQTLISEKDIFQKALSYNSSSIILVHNHPSNDPTPSNEDIQITKNIAEVGHKIGIFLIDHIIFCDSSYKSLKNLNLFSSYKFVQDKI